MEENTSLCFYETERRHHPSTHSAIPRHNKTLHCGAQLSQIHNGTEFPVAFLSHMFRDTQRRWSTPEQEAYGIYFAVKKWNYYLQGADIIVRNDHKPLARFLNGQNENTKIDRWGLELTSYNITFEWISGAKNKAADCLS